MPETRTWLLLSYKVPRDPTSARVYIWRKLKRLCAIALNDAVWVLPDSAQTLEQFRWLASEIVEMGGEANLWQSKSLLNGNDGSLVKRFEEQAAVPYRKILAGLKRKKRDLAELSRQYQQAMTKDYFQSELGKQVRAALLAAKEQPHR